jgi:hypothetical protein
MLGRRHGSLRFLKRVDRFANAKPHNDKKKMFSRGAGLLNCAQLAEIGVVNDLIYCVTLRKCEENEDGPADCPNDDFPTDSFLQFRNLCDHPIDGRVSRRWTCPRCRRWS